MKINLFIDCLGAGGAQRQLVGLAIMLKEKGNDVKVCTYHEIDFYKSCLDENHVPNVIIPNASSTKRRILAVRNFFKKESPDWVIAYQETPSLVACAAKLLGCNYKLIVSERNTTQHVGMNERVRFFLYRLADAIVPNSYSQENYLKQHYPWMSNKLQTITNFVDLDRFEFVPRQRGVIPHVVVAATIWPPKNTIGLIKAAKSLRDKGNKFLIEWFGLSDNNIDYQEKCFKLIEEYNLQDFVKLLPKTKQIQDKYKDCDFFCLPSLYEGTPNVICEAIASGRPVLCSSVCDNPYYVYEGKNGFLFNPKSPESIVDAFLKAFRMTEQDYYSFCLYSRHIAENQLPEDLFLNKYLQIIENHRVF